MAGKNLVILIGNLGRDPEMRYFADGTAVANFSIATSETWKDKNTGEKKEKTEWHRIAAFRGLAEICGKYLSKGSKVYIEGKLQTRTYEKNGQTHYTTEIIAAQMQRLDSRRQDNQGGGGYDGGGYGGGPSDYGHHGGRDPFPEAPDDDIQF